MNLYKVLIKHFSPKDNVLAIIEYLLAKNDNDVYNYIDKKYAHGSWADAENKCNIYDIYDEYHNKIGTETYREKIMRLKGNINDDDIDLTDVYYGISAYGWELVEENVTWDTTHLIDLGIIVECKV